MEHMVDVILHLVDRGLLDELMAMSVGEISSAMEATSLRAVSYTHLRAHET